jgi:predicted nucleotidyltransferase
MKAKIDIPKKELEELCKRHHIKSLALFGSVLRNDFTPESDIDVLVEFEPGYTPGFAFFDIQAELSVIGAQGRLKHTTVSQSILQR